ncbi:MAG: TonB family protein [Myxococcales bacterium]|nr:TonB family protein [Myxococcales bacterium]
MKIPALLLEWPVALMAHVFAALMIWVANMISGPSEPMFKPEDVMEISMSGPPKSDSRMVQKASRTADAVRGSDAVAEPPPPNQSDMAFRTPDAPPVKGQADADLQRQKIMDDMKREQLLKDLSAPIGTQNRQASDPTGSGDGGEASGGINDPETARWIKKMKERVTPNWHPLLSICQANQKLTVVIKVPMNADGSLSGDPSVGTSSGNGSLDQSALRAVQQTTNLPPPPAKFSNGVVGVTTFSCSEA